MNIPAASADLTANPFFALVRGGELLSKSIVDNNPDRPAIVVMPGGKVKCASVRRKVTGLHAKDSDPGIGKWFDGAFLPRLHFSTSHHDFSRAAIVGLGTVDIDVGTLASDVGIVLLPEPDCAYGVRSRIRIRSMNGHRLGILVAGQKDVDIQIGSSLAYLWGDEPNGHTFYANECRDENGKFLGVVGGSVKVGKNRTKLMTGVVELDHTTFKLKGAESVYLECLDDTNPCGALDVFDSSGMANLRLETSGSHSKNFQAFRISGHGEFGQPKGNMCVMGDFDCSLSDPELPGFRLESPNGRFAGVKVKGSPPYVWQGCDGFGSAVEDAWILN
jgi:hypothetical protein